MKKLLVTGSSGLIGSEVVAGFSAIGWEVNGVDNNMRAKLSPAPSEQPHSCGRCSIKHHRSDWILPAQTADSDRYRFRNRQTIPHFFACYGIEASNRGSTAQKPGRKIPILRQIRLAHDWLERVDLRRVIRPTEDGLPWV